MALTVDLAGLRSAAKSLESQRQAIYETYTSSVKTVLESSEECFYVAGLDTDTILESFNKIYDSFNNNATTLINALNNTITNYSDLQGILKQQFNQEFATKLTELLPNVDLIASTK